MSTTYDGYHTENTDPAGESPMFAATPVWDRGRKGLGPRRAPARTTPSTNADDTAPATRTRVTRSSSRPELIGATVISLAALGAAGWWMGRDTDGVPELTPGAPASAPAARPATTAAIAATEPTVPAQVPYTANHMAAVREAAPARRAAMTPRSRPARSAETAGVTASATIPDGPQPYSALNPQSEAAPKMSSPAPIPSTQPVQSAPQTTPQADPTPDAPTPDAPLN